MLKKLFILYLLLFSYTIVVGHSIIPHDHFEDLFHIPHDHHAHGGNHHQHHFQFSHSVNLHVADEKQSSIVTVHCFSTGLKIGQSDDFVTIQLYLRPPLLFSATTGFYHYLLKAPVPIGFPVLSDRAPPVHLA
jgi:hypothetical protein